MLLTSQGQQGPYDRRRNICRHPDVGHVFNVRGTMESCPTYFCLSPERLSRQGRVCGLGCIRVVDELEQNLGQDFSRTAQVVLRTFPIYPNLCIIENLEALLRGGVLGACGGLRDCANCGDWDCCVP